MTKYEMEVAVQYITNPPSTCRRCIFKTHPYRDENSTTYCCLNHPDGKYTHVDQKGCSGDKFLKRLLEVL